MHMYTLAQVGVLSFPSNNFSPFSMPFCYLQTGNYCPQHMPGEMFMFSHYSGYGLEPEVFVVLKRNPVHLNKMCIVIAGKLQ